MTKPLTLEIHGTGSHNRGAELMAIAIKRKLGGQFLDVRIAVPPNFGSYEERARHGFYVTDEFSGRIRTKAFLHFAPPGIRASLGLISTANVDCVIDASGFAFSDQWGSAPAKALVLKMQKESRRKQPLILLPQAFGPFVDVEVQRWTRLLLSRATLVCARDGESFRALLKLGCNPSKLRQYPDFTIGLPPNETHGVTLPETFTAVVPNVRMIDKGGAAGVYIEFLIRIISELTRRCMEPVIVLHDAKGDLEVVRKIEAQGMRLRVVNHSDPLALKAILGKAQAVVGSRFHALVSALSQGVPCVGAGWSHKYQELFTDFGIREYLISDLANSDLVGGIVNKLSSNQHQAYLRQQIQTTAEKLHRKSQVMWNEVAQVIRTSTNNGNAL